MSAPYYSDDFVTLYHGDCREILPGLSGADLALTDPPYNAGKDYGAHNDSMTPEAYERWCREWWPFLFAVTRRIAMFPGHGNLPMWYRISKPAAVGCWYKPGNPGKGILGFEEWEPWLYWHGGDRGLVGGSSVIRQPIETSEAIDHPCPKPIGLMGKLITKCRGLVTIDPFAGSGTTLVAAKRIGRHAIGIELEERYCEIAAKRLSQDVLDFGEVAS